MNARKIIEAEDPKEFLRRLPPKPPAAPMSERSFYKTTFLLTILSSRRVNDDNLGDLAHDISDGDAVGGWEVTEEIVLDGKQAADELTRQGSWPGFFGLNKDGSDDEHHQLGNEDDIQHEPELE